MRAGGGGGAREVGGVGLVGGLGVDRAMLSVNERSVSRGWWHKEPREQRTRAQRRLRATRSARQDVPSR